MGILERKEREKQLRRETIVSAAEAVFFEKGLRASTLDEIAERAELSKGTIYLYFSSKEDLYCSLMTRALILLLNAFREAGPEDKKPEEAVERLAEAYLKFSREQRCLFKMLSAVESPTVNEHVSPVVRAELEEASNNILSYVATFVQKGIDAGTFRNDIPAHEAVVLFWVSLSGILNLKERSSLLKAGNMMKAESIIGSVDFDGIYRRCQSFLLDFMAKAETRRRSRQTTHGKTKRAGVKSKAVGRK